MKKWMKVLTAVVGLLVLSSLAYINDYYKSDVSIAELQIEHPEVEYQFQDKVLRITPEGEEADTGIILYPGAKVEYLAYASLMTELANKGYACYIVDMPLRFAFFNIDAAAAIIASEPDINHWYLGGHSLGGAMAASYAAEHNNELSGLILLAAYSASDVSATQLPVLVIYGTEDEVLNLEKLKTNETNLPALDDTAVIRGGNHAQFGTYGTQDGDGRADISRKEQQEITADMIKQFIEHKEQ